MPKVALRDFSNLFESLRDKPVFRGKNLADSNSSKTSKQTGGSAAAGAKKPSASAQTVPEGARAEPKPADSYEAKPPSPKPAGHGANGGSAPVPSSPAGAPAAATKAAEGQASVASGSKQASAEGEDSPNMEGRFTREEKGKGPATSPAAEAAETLQAVVRGAAATGVLTVNHEGWYENSVGVAVIPVTYRRGNEELQLEIAITRHVNFRREDYADAGHAGAKQRAKLEELLRDLVEFSIESRDTAKVPTQSAWKVTMTMGANNQLARGVLTAAPNGDKQSELYLFDHDTNNSRPKLLPLDEQPRLRAHESRQQWLDQMAQQMRLVMRGESDIVIANKAADEGQKEAQRANETAQAERLREGRAADAVRASADKS